MGTLHFGRSQRFRVNFNGPKALNSGILRLELAWDNWGTSAVDFPKTFAGDILALAARTAPKPCSQTCPT